MSSTKLSFNSDLEMAVLCSCISNLDALNKSVEILDPEDFFCGNNALIFRSMQFFYEGNIELRVSPLLVKISAEITQAEKQTLLHHFEKNLYELADASILEIKDLARRRKIVFAASDLLKEAPNLDVDTEKILDDHTKTLQIAFAGKSQELTTCSDVLKNFKNERTYKQYIREIYDRVQKGESPYQGVKSGYHKLDYAIGSFQDGSLTYIGGLTSTGKTAFMLNLIYNMANEGTTVGLISLEMPPSTMAQNFVAMKLCIPFTKVQRMQLTKEELCRIEQMREEEPIFQDIIIDGKVTDIHVICSRIRRMVRSEGVRIVFIDYLTCMTVAGRYNTNAERVNVISKSLQAIGKELSIPIVCLAQFNREANKEDNKPPKISHFKESGSIEQDADTCIILHRPKRVDKKSHDRTLHVMIEKNRLMGDITTVHYLWDENRWGFYLELDDPQPYQQEVSYQQTAKDSYYEVHR